MKRALADISSELIIQPWQTGIRLVKPTKTLSQTDNVITMQHMLQLPINFYLMNHESKMMALNERTAMSCGYVSPSDAIGKSLLDVAKKGTTQHILLNDRKIVATASLKLIIENYTRLDDIELTAVSLKFPWFENNRVVGIFGCSFLIENHQTISFSHVLKNLFQQEWLGNHQRAMLMSTTQKQTVAGVLLSEQDLKILNLLIRGNTAKSIGKMMGLSHRTIEHHLEKIKLKFSVNSRAELIAKVIDCLC